MITRFAPSPTGRLHLGHAYSALLAHQMARRAGGRFLLRIEDIDADRCREAYVDAIMADLAWLGIRWDGPVVRQSRRMPAYENALAALRDQGLVYPCFCTRREIADEVARAKRAPHGPDGPLYPGTCRGLSHEERSERLDQGEGHAWRLDTARALEAAPGPLWWEDTEAGVIQADPASLGDVVLARKDVPTSYHLAVTLDDGVQGVDHIVRGEDLFHATHMHRLLQALLGLPTPLYTHHRLVTDQSGRRLAKRDQAQTVAALRDAGVTPGAILHRLGLDAG